MNKIKTKKRILALAFCAMFLFGSVSVQAEEKITPSKEKYEVQIEDANHVFIGNEKKVDWNVGDKYFLTYTVDKVTYDKTTQSGVIATTDNTSEYPHTKGGMKYSNAGSLLCEEGWTYFFRFEVTEDGLKTVVAKAKGQENEYIRLPSVYGKLTEEYPYFGVWMSETGKVSAKLTYVRCYDEDGNNLGIYGNKGQGVSVINTTIMKPNKSVEHSYSFSVSKASRFAFGSLRHTDSDVIYLEYTVNNVDAKNVTQSGAIMTNKPREVYPHSGDGYLNYSMHLNEKTECMLLDEGAKYIIRFERLEDTFEVLVKRTLNGKDTYFSFRHFYGNYKPDYGYVTAWFGEHCSLAADFTNVKCYDAKGHNLAIQTNQGVNIKHYGPLEDYSECEAVYYCKENDTFITLDDECHASKWVDGTETADMGTYSISQAVLTLKIGDQKEDFDYVYKSFTDADGNTYVRLEESTVTFRTRSMGGEVIETVQTTAENGFKIAKPSDPKEKGLTFACWKTGEGKEYNFDDVVIENMELYATWNGEGKYTATSILGENVNPAILVVGILCVVLVVGTTVGIVMISRRKKHVTEN